MENLHSYFKNIWLADDDVDDQIIFESAIRKVLPHSNLSIFNSSEDLIAGLHDATPDLLFLDINMPEIKGTICLKIIRENLRLVDLPVIIHSASGYHKDIMASYNYGATLYVVKPALYDHLVHTLQDIFLLDWKDPIKITNDQFINNQFIPFGAA